MSNEKYHISHPPPDEPQDMGVSPEKRPIEGARSVAELRITALAAGGAGVGRHHGKVWFVPGGIPGDRVRAAAVREQTRFVQASLERLLQASPDRREPPCRFQPGCGGCPWMVLGEERQRDWKRRLIEDALERIAGLDDVAVEEMRIGSRQLGYRNKIELTLGLDEEGGPAIGLHSGEARGSLTDVACCSVQHDAANEILASAREFLLDPAAEERREWFRRREPYRLILRRSWATGQLLAGLRETGRPFPRLDALARFLVERHPRIHGVVRIRARPGRRGGSQTELLAGRDWIEERLGGLRFRLPAATFLQVNPEMAQRMIEEIRAAAGPVGGRRIWDLYGGVGAYGLALARLGSQSLICDADRQAIQCGRETARRNRIARARFVHADVKSFLADRTNETADLVIANPPRAGLGRGVAQAIAAGNPARVVLVSCHPASMARDLRVFADGGYRTERVIPFDLFPQTAHVEAIGVLGRV